VSRIAALLVSVLFSGLCLTAQEAPRVEVFGGYSLARIDDRQGLTQDHIIQNGWNAAVAFDISKNLGIVSDFGGYYGTHRAPSTTFSGTTTPGNLESNKFHTFMFGPQVSVRSPRTSPFVHALFGAVHVHGNDEPATGITLTKTGFAWALGAGVDTNLSHRIAFRVQGDFLRFNLAQTTVEKPENNFRVSTGLVFRFGN
jgi:opacity protein-like surface antigen